MAVKKKLKYEEALEKIDEIISKLENGEIELEESVKNYEEAMELIAHCNGIINDVEGKVKKIVDKNNGIEYEEFPVE